MTRPRSQLSRGESGERQETAGLPMQSSGLLHCSPEKIVLA